LKKGEEKCDQVIAFDSNKEGVKAIYIDIK